MSTPATLPANFDGWDKAAAPATLPANFSGWDQQRAEAPAEKGWLDKEIPLDSYTHATESGVQSIGRGVRDAVKGTISMLDPRAQNDEEQALVGMDQKNRVALPVYRMLRSLGHTASDATQISAAMHDINESPDPVGTYAKVAQETAGQGAGQALTALGTEGALRAAVGALSDTPAAATAVRVVRTAGKTAVDAAKDIPGVRALTKLKANWDATAPQPSPDATGENVDYAGAPAPKEAAPPKQAKWDANDATGENRPFAGGFDEWSAAKKAAVTGQKAPVSAPEVSPTQAQAIPEPMSQTSDGRPIPRMYRVIPKEGPNIGEQRNVFASGDSAVQHFIGDLSNDSIEALARKRGIPQAKIDSLQAQGKASIVKGSGEGGILTAEDIQNNVKTTNARSPLTEAIMDTYSPEELADKAERGNTLFRGTNGPRSLGKGAAAKEKLTINAMFPELQ